VARKRDDNRALVRLISRALALPEAQPFLAEYLDELAYAYQELGCFDEAIDAMRRALAAGWDGELDDHPSAEALRETIARRPGRPQHRTEHAHFTKLSALSTIGALEALAARTGEPKLADRQWVMHSAAREAVESWDEIRDERNGLQYAIASWLTLALGAYLAALESNVEVEPMEIAKWLTRALAWTAGELAASEDESQPLLS
jgi:hypothetical protein